MSVSSSSVPNAVSRLNPSPVSVADIPSNQVGTIGEGLHEEALEAVGANFATRAPITVRLRSGEVFDVVPDFLRVVEIDEASGLARLDIDEIKTSRLSQPDIGRLTDNQAVLLDALLNGDIAEITAGRRLQEFLLDLEEIAELDEPIVGFTIRNFNLQSFQLF